MKRFAISFYKIDYLASTWAHRRGTLLAFVLVWHKSFQFNIVKRMEF